MSLEDLQCLEEYLEDKILLRGMASGHLHSIWIAQGRNTCYAIKRYEKHEAELASASSIANSFLFDRGFPVPKIFVRDESLYCDCANGLYLLQEYIPGQHVYAKTADWERIGMQLGELHTLFNCMTESAKSLIPVYHVPNIEQLHELLKTDLDKEYRAEVLQKISIFEEWNTLGDGALVESLESGIIHGDFYLGNLIECAREYYVIDFDGVEVFSPLYEVVKSFVTCLHITASHPQALRACEFLSGYKVMRKVSLNQFTLALELYLHVQTTCTYYFDKHYSMTFIQNRINELRYLLNNKARITEVAASVLED